MSNDFEEQRSANPIGAILLFSFISVYTLFIAILFFASLNNYALGELYDLTNQFVSSGIIPASFSSIADTIVSSIPTILPALDYIWFGSFVSMIISTFIYSYNSRRKNYFSTFTMLVLGLVLFMYLGSYILSITDWFINQIYIKVLPTVSSYTPLFNWYINNIAVTNLVLVVLNVVANVVDLDFSKFNSRKEDESFDEI